jgi:hypothetical protein
LGWGEYFFENGDMEAVLLSLAVAEKFFKAKFRQQCLKIAHKFLVGT